MLLPAVTEYSITSAPQRYADCARALGVAHLTDNTTEANTKLIAFLKMLNTELKVPTLAEFGADKTYFDSIVETMCEQAFASGSPNNNPRVPSLEEMRTIYQSLWS